MGHGLWNVFFVLLIIVALLFLIRWFMLRTNRAIGQSAKQGKSIQILERKALGARQSLLLVEVCGKKVLLHQSKGTLTPLCEVDPEVGAKQ